MALASPSRSLLFAEVHPVGDPLAALAALPGAFALRSSLPDAGASPRRARWSFFGADPWALHRGAHDDAVERAFAEAAHELEGDDTGAETGAPFRGGVVGYWAYDLGRRLERLPALASDDLALPDRVLGLYDVVVARDEDTGRTWLFSSGLPARGAERAERARRRLEEFRVRLETAPSTPSARGPERCGRIATSTFTPAAYRAAVEAVRDAIARGELFQANLSQRFTLPLPGALDHTLAFDAALREHTPSPFAATLMLGDHAVLSASPERFLALRAGRVETRPIKGTRPRGATPDGDDALATELRASAKDRAENVMIVDVLRNDLGRVCVTGSVEVPELCALEAFPQVWHLTSTVTGRLREGVDAFGLLAACFPGGSITGAPKIRAMQVLEGLEPVRRHLYTGAIGWIGWDGDADWNIAIRTAVATREALHWSAGGGITAESDPEAERRETLAKAEGLRVALGSVLGPVTFAEDEA
jgi:para-aminobenzoate synthetase component 1